MVIYHFPLSYPESSSLYKDYNIEKRVKEKVKLNNRKIKYIIKGKQKKIIYRNSKEIKITIMYVNYIYKNYKDKREYTISRSRTNEINKNDI